MAEQPRARADGGGQRTANTITADRRRRRSSTASLELVELVLVPRPDEGLAGQHQRGQHQRAAAEAEDAEARATRTPPAAGTQTPAANSATSSQPAVPPEVSAPEKQQEADGGHEAADADARRVQLDLEGGDADEQQQHGHARRGHGPDQEVGPARLDQRGIVLQAVVLLELTEVLDDAGWPGGIPRPGPVELQRPAGRRDGSRPFPICPDRACSANSVVAEIFDLAQRAAAR